VKPEKLSGKAPAHARGDSWQPMAVLGGGWAGLAAAVELADAGTPVTVYEAAPTLGGRARRVDFNGLALDNGLHLLIGAYRETLRLIEKVDGGARGLLRRPLDLNVPGEFRLRAARLPAPLHLAAGLLGARGLSVGQRLSAARFMARLRAAKFEIEQDSSVSGLLARFEQDARLRRCLWEPLCVAALNTRPEEASARLFLNVLRDALNGSRSDSDLLLPATDLSALFPEPAARFIAARGGRIAAGCAVHAVSRQSTGFVVRSQEGEARFAQVICALPAYRVPEVLGGVVELAPLLELIGRLRHDPIYSVYLQYSEGVRLPQAMLGLVGGRAQWAFDRGQLCGQHGLVGVVISARGLHQQLDQGALTGEIQAELRAALPQLPAPRWSKVIAEKRATFACLVGVERPPQRTPVPGLYLAGDYTASPYPATLEAAVRSGVACARMILERPKPKL
jgi:squalene-associated FAD-dependent desaturase